MKSEDDEMWLENLREWILDEDKVISAKYLSRSLKCHVNVAKQRLFHFTKEHPELDVVLLIAGTEKSTRMRKVKLIKKADLEKVESQMERITSKHVYAVGKNIFDLDAQLTGAVLDLVRNEPNNTNQYSAIVNKEVVVRPSEEVILDRPKVEVKQEAVKVKKEPPVKTDPAKKKQPVGIVGMFARAAEKKPAVKKVEVKKEAEESDEKSPGKENRINEKKDTKINAKKKSSTNNKRKRIQLMDSSDDDDEEDDENEDEIKTEEEEMAPPQAKLIISDDEEDDDIVPPTPEPAPVKESQGQKPGRRRVKKMVEKQIVDEDGFTTTKTQLESCSESDDEEQKKPVLIEKKVDDKKQQKQKVESVIKEPATKKPKGPPLKKKTGASGASGKQASIMSFFSKK